MLAAKNHFHNRGGDLYESTHSDKPGCGERSASHFTWGLGIAAKYTQTRCWFACKELFSR
jgi:hypothetical protein